MENVPERRCEKSGGGEGVYPGGRKAGPGDGRKVTGGTGVWVHVLWVSQVAFRAGACCEFKASLAAQRCPF